VAGAAPAGTGDHRYAVHEALRHATAVLDALFVRHAGSGYEANKRLTLSSGRTLIAPRVHGRVRPLDPWPALCNTVPS
jgi:hypothetical protein